MSLKRHLIEQCIKPAILYGCETWALTKVAGLKLIRGQRRIERAILGIRLSDKVNWTISAMKRKWKFATKLATQMGADWAQMTTLWKPKKTRPLGRPKTRWTDDLAKETGCKKTEFQLTQQNLIPSRATPYARHQLKRWVKEAVQL
ncbi:hypothetical protein FO519_004142 [Halicephalobus sp. NKZ332]|nr:hypothetical protein FO519_004142 [Halicephalobus sp. NKZ332]